MSRAVLEARAISKAYPGTQALDGVSMALAEGEILALLGHNGAGKSTLTRVLAGAETADDGDVLIDGRSVRLRSPEAAQALGIGYVPQPLSLVPTLTARENLLLGRNGTAARGRKARGIAERRLKEIAADLGITAQLDHPVASLRPVTQRLLMIGRALFAAPRVLILDEPTANLPQAEADRLFALVRSLARDRASVIYISHRLDEVLALVDRLVVLRQGRVVAERPAAGTAKGDLVDLITGHVSSPDQAQETRPRPRSDKAVRTNGAEPALLRCEALSAAPGTRDVHLHLERGQVLGLAGLDGSGRTSLLRALWGDRPRIGGEIVVKGKAVAMRSPREAIRHGLAYLPEERAANALCPELRVHENVTLPTLSRFSRAGLVNRRAEIRRLDDLLHRLDVRPLDGAAMRKIKTFSGGNQQKLVIARWLLSGADVFLFDEPTQGIDVGAKEQVYTVMRELAANGAGLIVASSEADELVHLCDRVAVMSDGTIATELAGDRLTEAALTRAIVDPAGVTGRDR